jgi:hypothetical protein
MTGDKLIGRAELFSKRSRRSSPSGPELVRKEISTHLLTYNLVGTIIAQAGVMRTATHCSSAYFFKESSGSEVHDSAGGRTLTLHISQLQPTWGMEIMPPGRD